MNNIGWGEFFEACDKVCEASKNATYFVIVPPKKYREYMIYKNRWYRRLWRWIVKRGNKL